MFGIIASRKIQRHRAPVSALNDVIRPNDHRAAVKTAKVCKVGVRVKFAGNCIYLRLSSGAVAFALHSHQFRWEGFVLGVSFYVRSNQLVQRHDLILELVLL